jgi:hypothetical protein
MHGSTYPNRATRRLYHSDVYMPPCLRTPVFEGPLTYTTHAKEAALDDRYGVIPLPKVFEAAGAQLIEVETENGFPIKQLWRQKLDKENDLILVITKEGRVKTVWLNRADDKHTTLQTGKYQKERTAT